MRIFFIFVWLKLHNQLYIPLKFYLDRLDFKRTSLGRCVKIVCLYVSSRYLHWMPTASICQSILQSSNVYKTMLKSSSFIDFTQLFIKQNWKFISPAKTSLTKCSTLCQHYYEVPNYKLTIVQASNALNLHVLFRVSIPTVTPGAKLYMRPC